MDGNGLEQYANRDWVCKTPYSQASQLNYDSKEHIFAHRLRCILRIDAGRAQEEELLHAMRISVADYVALHLHVLHDEVCTCLLYTSWW